MKAVADCLIAFELRGLDGDAYEDQRTDEAEKVQLLMKRDADASLKSQTPTINQLSAHAREQLQGRRPFHWPVEFPEVFARGGFDAFVGNPPFMGGQKITGALGTSYRNFLIAHVAKDKRGSADFCSYFFLRGFEMIRQHGLLGLVATNTIAQGDTREVGLDQIVANGGAIPRAVASRPWPGVASLEVAHVWIHRGIWNGLYVLEDSQVSGINAFLSAPTTTVGKPYRLAESSSTAFQGSIVLGMGYILEPQIAKQLLAKNPRNKDVLFPYLGGDDLTSSPDFSPSRWVINFFDWPLNRTLTGSWAKATKQQREEWLNQGSVPKDYPDPVAGDYPDCLEIIERSVLPERTRRKPDGSFCLRWPLYERWWIYAEKRPALYEAIKNVELFYIRALTSKHHGFAVLKPGIVVNQTTVAVVSEDWGLFCVLSSDLHYAWALKYGNKLENRPQYTHGECFENFPFPTTGTGLITRGREFEAFRNGIMQTRQEGLTKTYNRFHDRCEQAADIARLRALHVEMDQAVAAAYGWSDLDLGHGFHATKQGERYTLSEPARRTVLDRLLALNHQRYAEEVKAGLHDKATKKAASKKKKSDATAPQGELIKPPQEELFG